MASRMMNPFQKVSIDLPRSIRGITISGSYDLTKCISQVIFKIKIII